MCSSHCPSQAGSWRHREHRLTAHAYGAPRVPASYGGGYVLFSNSGMGDHGWVASNGLYAGHLTDLDSFGQPDGEGGMHPHMQQVFAPPAVDIFDFYT